MQRKLESSLSRRDVLIGAASVTLVASAPTALAARVRPTQNRRQKQAQLAGPVRRYMAGSAALPDGRIVVTGGYDRPFVDGNTPRALNSVVIYDPATGLWTSASPMQGARARHAAVGLADGRILVLGGMGMNPTSSVEVYDPRTDSWTALAPLAQPRYDHSAVNDGANIYVLGGSSQQMLSTVEVYHP